MKKKIIINVGVGITLIVIVFSSWRLNDRAAAEFNRKLGAEVIRGAQTIRLRDRFDEPWHCVFVFGGYTSSSQINSLFAVSSG